MCGILGAVPSVRTSLFKSSLDCLAHRGPDGEGIWSDLGNIILGHRRLSILDLTKKAYQPMTEIHGRYTIVFNGEIYNFIEIRKELEELGYVFQSKSDTEVVLLAFCEWGEDCLKRFNGMWAFAIWDKKEKTLFLSRDRFGKKPLFFTKLSNGGFVFSSEMKALYCFLKEVSPSKKINEHLAYLFDYEHTADCVIQGIERLPAGHLAVYKNGYLSVRRWWNTLDHIEKPPKRYEEQVERWRELFLDSVRIRMRSDVPIGTALSGGIDSSAVLSAMSYIGTSPNNKFYGTSNWQNAFNCSYPKSTLDESKWAKIVTHSLGIPLKIIEIDPAKNEWSIKNSLYQVEDPCLACPLPMLTTYREISRSGIKVTIDGHGADELFSGYGELSNALFSMNPHQASELLAIKDSLITGSFDPNYKNLNIRWLKSRLTEYLRLYSKLPQRIAKAVIGKLDWNLVNHKLNFKDQSHSVFKQFDPLTKQLYQIFHISILPTLLRNYDRCSMASGVEIRMPFMDWRLVAFTFSLPLTSKVGGGFTKRIMRDALKDILPEKTRVRRDKIGWDVPMHEWLKGPFKKEVDLLIQSEEIAPQLNREWKNFQKKIKVNYMDGLKIWTRIMPYFWRKIFLAK
jgi:asparagine synthase (glutamine-hydrolysing)